MMFRSSLAQLAVVLALLIISGKASESPTVPSPSNTVSGPPRECTVKYVKDEAGCSCFVFNRDGTYPPGIEPLCRAAFANVWGQKWRCASYTAADGTVSQDALDNALVWTVERCLADNVGSTRFISLSTSARKVTGHSTRNLPSTTERLPFLAALIPVITKLVVKTAVTSGARLAAKAAAKAAAKRVAAEAAKRAAQRAATQAAKKAAQRAAQAAEKARKAAQEAARAAKRRAEAVKLAAERAARAAREAAKRVVRRARNKARELLRQARKFARKEARRVAECVNEKADALRTDGAAVVDADVGTVRDVVDECLKESRVVCVGLVGAEAVRGEQDAESLSFFADLAACLSDARGVCVSAATVKFAEGSLSELEYVEEMSGCFEDFDKCGREIANLVIAKKIVAPEATTRAKICDDAEKQMKNNNK